MKIEHRARRRSLWLTVPTAVAALLSTHLAGPVAAKPTSCKQSCRTLQTNCITHARTEFTAVRAACTAGSCRRGARTTFRGAVRSCRQLGRKKCRPCCPLGGPNECARQAGVALSAEPQAGGDPVRGRQLLLEGDYMTCGVPYRLWEQPPLRQLLAGGFGGGANAPRLERGGKNADLPYFLNTFATPEGVEVINGNCLMCHGGVFDGQLIVGLGNAVADFTRGAGGVPDVPLTDDILDLLGLTEGEKGELRKIAARADILAPVTKMRAVGMNPAELLAVVLMVHHVRDTLAWSDTEVTPFVIKDAAGQAIPDALLTSDPPPWWRAHKKNALFYNGMARGDHRGTMALATSVCVDDIPRAQQVDDMFRDIQAFVASLRAPTYTRPIDASLTGRGQEVFTRDCAGCHGTYSTPDDQGEFYPNLLIPLDVIGTDPVVAEAGVVHSPELVAWYNQSFYGQITRMVPNDPFPGYMPPPLDGIWATAPYLHNGSVPTVELVLDSRARPRAWRRVDLDSTNFEEDELGWPWVAVDASATLPAAEARLVYDTTKFSQSNAGHPFGDHLTAEERRAVIEYLKTL